MRREEGLKYFSSECIDRFLLFGDLEPSHRFMRSVQHRTFLSGFVRGADLVAEYPLHALFFTWSLSVLTMEAGFLALAGMTLSILGASLTYRWARGPKTLDPEAYQNYLGSLDTLSTAMMSWNAVRWPDGLDEEDTFFECHSRQLEYLAERNRWEHIANMMDSIRQRFPVNGIKGHLSLRLMTYFYKLHAYSNVLHVSDKQALLKNFLKRWLSKNGRKQPSISTGLECASFLRPIYETDLMRVGRKNYNNTRVFLSLSSSEQQQIIDHLFAGDRRCLFVLVSLCVGDDRLLSSQLMHDILEKYRKMHDADLESEEQMGQLLMAHLMQQKALDVSPTLAAWIYHLYGRGQNIMRSLMKPYDDFPDVSDTFQIENGFADLLSGGLELLLASKNDPSSQQMSQLFLEFVLGCPDKAVSQCLSIFKSALPINNLQGPLLLYQRFVSMQAPNEFIPRMAAMLIFALHPPEYFEPYENKSRFFKKTPVLFSRETQRILQAFQRSVDLGDDQNQDICDTLRTFGLQAHWLDLLKKESRCLQGLMLNV